MAGCDAATGGERSHTTSGAIPLPKLRSSSRKRGPRFTAGALTSRGVWFPDGTVCIGSTGSLEGRVIEHREGLIPGFASRSGLKWPVWCEAFESRNAFRRERQMKVWHRAWQIELIEKTNPGWRDLYPEIC